MYILQHFVFLTCLGRYGYCYKDLVVTTCAMLSSRRTIRVYPARSDPFTFTEGLVKGYLTL